jgi:hypothetical protein
LFVIDAGKCFGPPPPGKTVLQNGDSTAKGVLYVERFTSLPMRAACPAHIILHDFITVMIFGEE